MQVDETTRLIEAIAKLVGAIAWPVVVGLGIVLLRPYSLKEFRIRGKGVELSATREAIVRQWDADMVSQELREFWKPNGKVDRTNSARIAACKASAAVLHRSLTAGNRKIVPASLRSYRFFDEVLECSAVSRHPNRHLSGRKPSPRFQTTNWT